MSRYQFTADAGRRGGQASGRTRGKRARLKALEVARQALLDARSDWTADDLRGVLEVIYGVYRRAYKAGYQTAWVQRARAQRKEAA